MSGTVVDIFVAESGGETMKRVHEVEAMEGGGLRGDRYMERKGYWTDVDECQVTLIEAEALEEIRERTDIRAGDGEHRRNIVTRGIDLQELAGKRFAVGDAEMEFDRPRPPCGYIQGLTQRGMMKALGGTRGGRCDRPDDRRDRMSLCSAQVDD